MKKILALTLSLLLVATLLFGCGAKSESLANGGAAMDMQYSSAESPKEDYVTEDSLTTGTGESIVSTDAVLQKLVRKV